MRTPRPGRALLVTAALMSLGLAGCSSSPSTAEGVRIEPPVSAAERPAEPTVSSSTSTASTSTTSTSTTSTSTTSPRPTSTTRRTTSTARETTPVPTRAAPRAGAGAEARKIVIEALGSVDRHGPYRAVITLKSKGEPATTFATCEFVPPDRDHCALGAFGKTALESITIGTRVWTRSKDGAWQRGTPDDVVGSTQQPPDTSDIVRVTPQGSGGELRTFAVVLKDNPASAREVVVVDRQGRLRRVSVTTAEGALVFDYTYSRSIRIEPPV